MERQNYGEPTNITEIIEEPVRPLDESIIDDAQKDETVSNEAPTSSNGGSAVTLLSHEGSEHFRMRWNEIQSKFVDEPRSAVQQADTLVSEVIGHLSQMIESEQSSLKRRWEQGSDISTEDLRKTLQHYRSFFNRLVS